VKVYIHEYYVLRAVSDNINSETFALVRYDVFANNRLSLNLVSSTPLSIVVLLATPTKLEVLSKVYACLTDPEYSTSFASDKSVFMYRFKDEGITSFFDYLQKNVR
jgi:hypothetical protein